MKQVLILANLLAMNAMWTAFFQMFFPNTVSYTRNTAIIHFVSISAATMLFCLLPVFPIHAMIVGVLLSSIIIWMTDKGKKKLSIEVVENLIAALASKVIYLCTSIIMSALFLVLGGEYNEYAAPLLQFVLLELAYIVVKCWLDGKNMEPVLQRYSIVATIVAAILFFYSYSLIKRPYYIWDKRFKKFVIIVILSLFTIIILFFINLHSDHTSYERLESRVIDLLRATHRQKELLPAIVYLLREIYWIVSRFLDDKTLEKLQKIINELDGVRKDGGAEDQTDYYKEQTFSTTGFTLLDSQLLDEQGRSARRDIDFKVIVREPVADLVEQGILNQTLVQRIIGDLFRNASRAIEQRGSGGEILLSMGFTARGYQIRMSDTGTPFDAAVLNQIGARGISTSGSGHGFADILEALSTCGASLQINDYGVSQRTYTKGIAIIFDKLGKLRITSTREEVPDRIYDIAAIVAENRRREMQRLK